MNSRFAKAVEILDSLNSENLLSHSALLSTVEYFRSDVEILDKLFPTANHSISLLFTRCLLASKSSFYSESALTYGSMPTVFNHLSESVTIDYFRNSSDPDEDYFAVFGRVMYGSQMYYTRPMYATIQLALLDLLVNQIPQKYSSEIRRKCKSSYIQLPEYFEKVLGFETDDLLLAWYLIRQKYELATKRMCARVLVPTIGLLSSIGFDRQAVSQHAYLTISTQLPKALEDLAFYATDFLAAVPFVFREKVSRVLGMLTCTLSRCREQMSEDRYQKGAFCSRLIPFEYTPIVEMPSTAIIVPNLRLLDLAVSDTVMYRLGASLRGNAFRQNLGYCQEFLIYEMLKKSFPESVCLPELKYPSNRSDDRGPDILFIENDRMIAFESKATQISLDARVGETPEAISKNLEGALSVLEKLERDKLPRVINGDGEYFQHIESFKKLKWPVLSFVVIGGNYFQLQEHVSSQSNGDTLGQNIDLRRSGVISLQNLLQAIEVARQSGVSLYELLLEYLEVAERNDPTEAAAEHFGGRNVNHQSSLLGQSYKGMVERLMIRMNK